MSSLKNQKKKFLINEIASETMECLLGLSEKNKTLIRRLAEKSSRKIVDVYYEAIKAQHRKALKSVRKRKAESFRNDPLFSKKQTSLMAS